MIDQAIYHNKKLYTCFVDFRKAYDTIWRDGLYYKLLGNGVSKSFVRLLKSIYDNSSLSVQLALGVTANFPSKVGLKQGCNLSPILFNLFINDFIEELQMPMEGTSHIDGLPVNCLFYADDFVLVSESEKGLQALLDKLYRYTSAWFLQINPKKTTA